MAVNGSHSHPGVARADPTRCWFAFETTLGGKSVTAKILEAAKTHDVLIWFCGLSSPELHIENGQAVSPAPDDLEALQRAPEWSKSILEAALLRRRNLGQRHLHRRRVTGDGVKLLQGRAFARS